MNVRPPIQFIDLPDVRPTIDDLPEKVRDIIERINRKIAAAESLDQVMHFYYESTLPIFPCDRLGLSFLDEDGLRVTAHWLRAEYSPVLLGKGYTEDLQGSSLYDVIKNGRPRIINDLEQYSTEHPDSRSTRILLQEGVRSSMTCPLKVENRSVGLLFRSSRNKNAYSRLEIMQHLVLAERLSQAIEKAFRIEQLTAANTAYFEMLGFVSHELKSPVSSIVMDAKVLLQGYLGELSDDQSAKILKMVHKGEYLLGLVREYLDLARIESNQLNPKPVKLDIREIIDVSIDMVKPQADQKKMSISVELPQSPQPVECDPDLFKIVMVNLIGNGVKYGFEEGGVRIRMTQSPSGFTISVENDGPGFPETERSRLFRKFSRLQTPELRKQKGTGVGLYSVYRIVQAHHGHNRAYSEHGKWARFTLEIPQPIGSEDGSIKSEKGKLV